MISLPKTFSFGEDYLTAGIAIAMAKGETKMILTAVTRKKVTSSWEIVRNIVEKGHPVYGINTGFGPLCTTKISMDETKILQANILQSHSVGVGDAIDSEIAKLMMILNGYCRLLGGNRSWLRLGL